MLKKRYIFLAAFLIVILITLQSGIADGQNEINFDLDATVFYAINYFTWALIIPFYYRLISERSFSLQDSIVVLLQSLSLILIHFLVTNLVYFLTKQLYETIYFQDFLQITGNYLYESFFRRGVDLLLIFGVLKVFENYIVSVKRKEQMEVLKLQLQEVKFETLKSQLNPHFLFNAIHSVYSMIGHEDEKAKKMIIKISDLMRKMLEDSDLQEIPLSEELEYVSDYLSIEKERFHDRLSIQMFIDEESTSKLVPSLILQPLVENAIKHGIAPLEEGGTITLSSKVIGNDLEITVKNPKPRTPKRTESLGIGLSNLKERLKTLDPEHQIETKVSDNHYQVSIILKDQVTV